MIHRTHVLIPLVLLVALALSGCAGTHPPTASAAGDATSALSPIIAPPSDAPTPTVPVIPINQVARASTQRWVAALNQPADSAAWSVRDLVALQPDEAPARWDVLNNAIQQRGTGARGEIRSAPTVALAGDATWTDYTVTAQGYAEGNSEMGLVARASATSFYRLRAFHTGTAGGPTIVLELVQADRVITLQSQAAPGFAAYRWYQLALSVHGSQISGQFGTNPPMITTDAALAHGQIGVYGLAMGGLRFSAITVTE